MKQLLTLFLFGYLCTTLTAQYIMDGSSILDCEGTFHDSGGDAANYGANENFTTQICPDLSSGTHIRLHLSNISIGSGDELCFYDGPDTFSPLLDCISPLNPLNAVLIQATAANSSGCITVSFQSDGSEEAAGWSAFIRCVAACQPILAQLLVSDPPAVPADTGWIDICPGEEVQFSGSGQYPQDGILYNHSDQTCEFIWNFGDGNLATGTSVSHIFEEPGGYLVELLIRDQFGCINANSISQRVRVAAPPQIVLAPELPPVCVGDTIQLNALVGSIDTTYSVSVAPVESNFRASTIRSDSIPLPDGDGASYETSIHVAGFSPGQVLTDIDDLLGICVNMEHSYMFDLQITISCPNGSSVTLVQQNQTINETYIGAPYQLDDINTPDPPAPGVGWDYCWTPNAPNGTWTTYVWAYNPDTLPAGDYSSYGPLTDLLGCPLNGEWTITVTDLWTRDNGWIFSWNLNLNPDLYPVQETFIPAITDYRWLDDSDIIQNSPDMISVSPSTAGTAGYIFEVTDEFGCVHQNAVGLPVLPSMHPDCLNCPSDLEGLRDTALCDGESFTVNAIPESLDIEEVMFESKAYVDIVDSLHFPGAELTNNLAVNSLQPAQLSDAASQISSVCIELTHGQIGELDIYLQAPGGQGMALSTGNGGAGTAFSQTCFSSTAASAITTGTAPFSGDYQPQGSWASLNGSPLNGDWQLLIADNFPNNSRGRLLSWSITFVNEYVQNFSWSPPAGISCTDCPDPVISPSVSTQYLLTVADNYNCIIQDTVNVSVEAGLMAPLPACQATAADAMSFSWPPVSGAVDYEISIDSGANWLPANGNLSHLLSGLTAGTVIDFWVRATNPAALCTAPYGSIQCTFGGCLLTIDTLAMGPPVCWDDPFGRIVLTSSNAEGNVVYYLDTTGPFGPTIDNVLPGNHSLEVVDDWGCRAVMNINMPAAPQPISFAIAIDSIDCAGDADGTISVLPTGGSPPYRYEWSNAQTTNSIGNLTAGSYSLRLVDAKDCDTTIIIELTEPNPLIMSFLAQSPACGSSSSGSLSILANGGVAPYSYQWSDGFDGPLHDNIAGGYYEATVTDAKGCTAVGNYQLPVFGDLFADLQQIDTACFGENQNAAVVAISGGMPPFQILWDNGSTTSAAYSLAAGMHSLSITDANGCSLVDSIFIVQHDSIAIYTSWQPPACYQSNDGFVRVDSVKGGNGDYQFRWNYNASQSSEISTLPGDQNYQLTVTDGNGCTNSFEVYLEEPSPIELIISVLDAKCFGFNDGAVSVTPLVGPLADYNFQWGATANFQTGHQLDSLAAGSYSLTVTDVNGCSMDTTVLIGQASPIELSFVVEDNRCADEERGSIEVTAAGGVPAYQYIWADGQPGKKIDQLASDWYQLTVVDAQGCQGTDSVWVSSPPPLTARLSVDSIRCAGERNGAIFIDPQGGSPPYQYSFNGEDFNEMNALLGIGPGKYDAFVQDANGCLWQSNADLIEPPPFELDTGDERLVRLGDSTRLWVSPVNGIGWISYVWSAPTDSSLHCPGGGLNCQAPWFYALHSGIFYVQAIDERGCQANGMVRVRVEKDRPAFVPTGFTPNGDGVNDRLLVHGKNQEGTKIKLFQLFDRWGELLYEASDFEFNNPDVGWDGTFRAKPAMPGLYIWVLEIEYLDGYSEVLKGNTSLIR